MTRSSLLFSLMTSLALASSAQAGGLLDPSVARGTSIAKFAVPGKSASEICVVPKHLAFGDYKGSDAKKEQELCKLNFYDASGTTDATGDVALCPKTNSTSAAVLLYSIPDGKTKSELEGATSCLGLEAKVANKPKGQSKQVGKFKNTDDDRTCTYTQADLGYYHVSRVLGDIGQVVPTVLRTMDFDQHDKIVTEALGISKVINNHNLHESWSNFKKFSSGSSSNPGTVFTVDNTQIYGAMLAHGGGDERYKDWITDSSSAETSLPSVGAYKNVTSSSSAASILGSRDFNQANAQKLAAMRDMGDMILLDYLMQQNDRFSGNNINDTHETVYQDATGVHHVKDSTQVPAGSTGFDIKRVSLGDNDCGLIEGSGSVVKGGYLGQIRHMHPTTYVRLMQFADKWANDPSVKAFFQSEALFSDKLAANFEAGLMKARDTLKASCKASDHFLDLDMDNYFTGKDADKSLCDATTVAALSGSFHQRLPAQAK